MAIYLRSVTGAFCEALSRIYFMNIYYVEDEIERYIADGTFRPTLRHSHYKFKFSTIHHKIIYVV